MDLAEKEFDDAMQFGTITHYNPSLTLASLAEFMPATPSTPAGRAATALQNLSLMGPTDPIGAPQDLQARSYAQDLEVAGVRFFANATAIEAAEEFLQLKRRDEAAAKAGEGEKGDASSVNGSEERIIQPADETVRQVIVDKAIAGHHEAPQYATDPVGLARSWHLRAETYAPTDVDKFEKKLQSLLSKVPKASAGRGARQNGRRAA
ncbi:hypothetical protein G6O67_008446 [Ophiocordyceps sinensis]|nr:hypothetical protein G6O67_008446 [Ophiocordyceps sinensis]